MLVEGAAMTDRDHKGRFMAGNSSALTGWKALIAKRFAGDEAACRRWWGMMGAWHYDAPPCVSKMLRSATGLHPTVKRPSAPAS